MANIIEKGAIALLFLSLVIPAGWSVETWDNKMETTRIRKTRGPLLGVYMSMFVGRVHDVHIGP